jgi:vancomycin resistance protein YoaR
MPNAEGTALPGVRVGGAALLPGEPVRPRVEARARALLERRVRLIVRDGDTSRTIVESSLGALGASVDIVAITSQVLRIGRAGDILARAQIAEIARRGELDVPLLATVDPRVAIEILMPLKEGIDVPPVLPRLDVEHHRVVPERPGRAVDLDATIAAITRAVADPQAVEVGVPIAVVAPRVNGATLAAIDVSRVVSSFATYFSRRGDQAPRAQNIEVAASHIDGLVMQPGEIVSFNDVVGARSEDNGFQKAFEIYKGEMVEGTGGGTCQVASTLHAIAFFGALDIVQRLPHSRPSPYIPVGLDATVVYPVVDLRLRNPYAFPVVVHATVGPNKLAMQLLGADKPARVALMRTVLSTTPFERKIVEDPIASKPKRKQKGVDGVTLLRKRFVAMRGGASRTETSRDTYPPTMEIWKVPPGYDEAELPPLGEDFPNPEARTGATGAPVAAEPPHPADPEQTLWGQ